MKPRNRISLSTLLLGILLHFCGMQSTFATTYKIELLLFSQLDPASILHQHWDNASRDFKIPKNALELKSTAFGDLPAAEHLARSDSVLETLATRLEKTHPFKMLGRFSWQEDLTPSHPPHLVHFTAGASVPDAENGGSVPEVEGMITLGVARYIEAHVHLIHAVSQERLRKLTAGRASTFPATSLVNFLMDEKRRLKSNELNYFDTPTLGILLFISPG